MLEGRRDEAGFRLLACRLTVAGMPLEHPC